MTDNNAPARSMGRILYLPTGGPCSIERRMITGDIKNQIDRIWNAFWSGGISNPLEVIEQITYLLFLRRLDDLHTLEENKADPAQAADGAPRLPRRARTPKRRPVRGPPLVALQELRAGGDVRRSSASTSSRSCARSAATTPPTRTT